MRKTLTIVLTVGLTFSAAFAAANLAPDKALAATCVRGAVPAEFATEIACNDWLVVSAEAKTVLTSVFGAHTVGNTSNYAPVTDPLSIQTSVYRNSTATGCALAVSVRFKWKGVPGAVGPNTSDKIIEIVPTLFGKDLLGNPVQPPTKGLMDIVGIDFSTKKLGWQISMSNSSTLTGKNGMSGVTENWNLSNGNPATTYYEDANHKSQGGIKPPAIEDVSLYQDDAAPSYVHYGSGASFRESHNRSNNQNDTATALPNIWFTSEGQFIWTAINAASCTSSAVKVTAKYTRNETAKRDACEYQVDIFDKIAKAVAGMVSVGTGVGVIGETITLIAGITLGQLTSVDARSTGCTDATKSKSQSTVTLFP